MHFKNLDRELVSIKAITKEEKMNRSEHPKAESLYVKNYFKYTFKAKWHYCNVYWPKLVNS